MKKRRKHFLRFSLLAAWLAVVSAGMAGLMRYSAKPGTPPRDPTAWPSEWELRPQPSGTTLVVALHPRCACSRATLGELAQLMTQNANGVRAYVLMIRPDGTPDGFEHSPLWDLAATIPVADWHRDWEQKLPAKRTHLTPKANSFSPVGSPPPAATWATAPVRTR
jgi:hypothetical protein